MLAPVFLWFWRTLAAPLRVLGAAVGGPRSGGAPSSSSSSSVAVLLSALVLAPMALSSPTSSLGVLSGLLRRVQDGVRGGLSAGVALTQPLRVARSAMEAVMELAARTPAGVMNRLMDWMPPMNDNVTSSDLMRSFGYPSEGHYVYTEDGYRLRLDRVPNPGRPPVYLAHGMQTSSPSFVLLGKGKALASMLHDAGYDVWMVNYRGTHYSQEHKKYTIHDEQFWKFSFHEHGAYDNTAAVDYVLRRTGFPSLMYVCHSMGCTAFMTMAATRPEYLAKVRAAFLLAPAGPLRFHRSPFVGLLYAVNNITQRATERMHLYHTMRPAYLFLRRMAKALLSWCPPAMYAFTSSIVGYNPAADYYDLPYFFETIPSGGSWAEVFHYEQNANPSLTGLRQYDHGAARNTEVYGTRMPPAYDLTSIDTPIYMYLSHNDILCTAGDTDYLRSQFRNVVRVHHAKDPAFNHLDFFAGKTAPWEVYQPLIADMQAFGAPDKADKDNGVQT